MTPQAGISPRRTFLGWRRPLPESVCRFLLDGLDGPLLDLSPLLVIVPTRGAGRRLREALVRAAAGRGAGLLPPAIETPAYLIDPGRHGIDCLCAAAELAHWAAVARKLPTPSYPALFPSQPEAKNFGWALTIGRLLRDLKSALVEGGHTVASAMAAAADRLREPELWRELAAIEQLYLQAVAAAGAADPAAARLALGQRPRLPAKVRRLVVAAVPDPLPLAVAAMARLSLPVDILIHAPAEESAGFDPWGRPLPSRWNSGAIDLSAPAAEVVAADDPAGQAQAVVAALAGAGDQAAAVCVADPELVPQLLATLADAGIDAYDPAGTPVSRHGVVLLLRLFRDLVESGSGRHLALFCRHGDALAWLADHAGCSGAALLQALDERMGEILPERMEDLFEHPGGNPALRRALAGLGDLLHRFRRQSLPEAVEELLTTVYGNRRIDDDDAGHLFRQSAGQLRTLLDECSRLHDFTLDRQDLFDLLLERLADATIYPAHDPASLEVGGWLENAWQDAPVLVIAGMNEGRVPARLRHSPFLPDSLAGSIGLRDEAFIAARDGLLLAAAVNERRHGGGAIVLTFGRRSLRGEPLLPSRLLFRCPDEELAGRAARLFASPAPPPPAPARTTPFPLTLPAGPYQPPERMSVTALGEYLDCPFRFYLRRVLGMERLDASKTELDALDFGTLAHAALEDMGREERIWSCADPGPIAAFLEDRLRVHVGGRFGKRLPAVVAWQMDTLRRRLTAAARLQAQLAADGWEILAIEEKGELRLDCLTVVGRIDRIDRHRRSGSLRIIDYKTGDRAKEPLTAHLGRAAGQTPTYAVTEVDGREKAWLDLQLPLYLHMLAAKGATGANTELAYWVLPKAISESGLQVWEGLTDGLLASALACARGVVRDIAAGVFWPPAPSPRHDDFAELFSGPAESCFRIPDWFRTRGQP
ncbi:MAG: PD-(D/E)XK nuclease family protein [Thermodesulfobacteriota bacterium]